MDLPHFIEAVGVMRRRPLGQHLARSLGERQLLPGIGHPRGLTEQPRNLDAEGVEIGISARGGVRRRAQGVAVPLGRREVDAVGRHTRQAQRRGIALRIERQREHHAVADADPLAVGIHAGAIGEDDAVERQGHRRLRGGTRREAHHGECGTTADQEVTRHQTG